MDAEGTFADRFDGERQLWIVVVGRLREVQRLEGLVQVGVCNLLQSGIPWRGTFRSSEGMAG